MADSIDNIDTGQTELEDKLLMELQRLRKLNLDTPYAPLDPNIQSELHWALDAVRSTMESAGDFTNLSLETERHDQVRDRMRVLNSLLTRKIPTVFIESCFQEARALKIKPDDPNFAARILLLLNQQVCRHHDDGHSIEQVMKSRASFEAKDLSQASASSSSARKIAQSPEEIRRKLAERGSVSQGASQFMARDLSSTSEPGPAAPAKPKIAQTPEDIRRKLAERGAAAQGKAIFGAKDIEPVQPKAPATSTPEKKTEPVMKGPAVFGSKDIEPLSDIAQRQRQRQEEAKKKAKAEKPAGKAVFLSRDLDEDDK